MADDDRQEDLDEGEEQEKSGGGRLKWILLGVFGGLLVIVGSVAGTLYFMGGFGGGEEAVAEAEAEPEAVQAAVKKSSTPYYIPVSPSFTINLSPDSLARYLKVSIALLTYDPDVDTALQKHKPQVRNALVLLFGNQNSQLLSNRIGREQLQKEALKTIQTTLKKVGVKGKVENLYFTDFVMQ